MPRFPVRILIHKQRQLAILSDKRLPASKVGVLLSESLERELLYIQAYKQQIDRTSVLWSFYQFMEAKLLMECFSRKKELAELISLPYLSQSF